MKFKLKKIIVFSLAISIDMSPPLWYACQIIYLYRNMNLNLNYDLTGDTIVIKMKFLWHTLRTNDKIFREPSHIGVKWLKAILKAKETNFCVISFETHCDGNKHFLWYLNFFSLDCIHFDYWCCCVCYWYHLLHDILLRGHF